MRELLSSKRAWNWGETAQEETFAKADTKISADASSHGLGAVLLQQQNQEWRPVAYASSSMSETETRYAQIEKEALAITWACEKFSTYILGKHISIETDHKPLVPLLGNNYSIQHVPGKLLYAADTLSRAPLREESDAQPYRANLREPLMSTPLPKHPWERVAADVLQLNSSTYLLVVDYFSRYPEVIKLNSTTSKAVISSLKSIFSCHGVPSVLMSDNGPQFDSSEMKEFANTYAFQHITSFPHYPQSNVWVRTGNSQIKGRIVSNADTPRSYVISIPNGQVCRNRQHLNHRLNTTNDSAPDIPDSSTTSDSTEPPRDRIMTRTQTGIDIRSPNRLRYD
ncbi:uncharacterized protein [Dysidea avara]|uniref:uncharacterized protein n=1 Tax=Dysidea avara TaxID=196820 RepID=UPI00332C5504